MTLSAVYARCVAPGIWAFAWRLWIGLAAPACWPALAAPPQVQVLVVYSAGRLLPANVEADRGLREVLRSSADRQVEVVDEFLDMPRLGGDAYEATMLRYLHDKYASRPPAVVVAGGQSALSFLLDHREALFAGVPVVHMGVSPAALRALRPLPPDIVGVPMQLAFAPTIELALKAHPKARRLVLVTGASAPDLEFEADLRQVLPQFAGRVNVEFLSALSHAEVLRRLGQLDSGSVVFTPGYFRDGGGQSFTPRQSVEAMAAVATAPIYGPFQTFIGTGVVGGEMAPFDLVGRQAGESVERLLAGVPPSSLVLPTVMSTMRFMDWRQAQRWGIDTAAIPPDVLWQFREPGLWAAHPVAMAVVAGALLLQTLLIAGMVVERRRRRRAERGEQRQRVELAHAMRLAVAGELTASIAHEINQPLGAILSYADTAELLLEAGSDRHEELRKLVAAIRSDGLRASEVVRRLRRLLAKHEVERLPIDLAEVVREVIGLLRSDASRRHVVLEAEPAPDSAMVLGDRTQLQQVLVNLLLNAMEATEGLPPSRRRVGVAVHRRGDQVLLTVRDQGPGIAPADLPRLFDSFFSTKPQGMGLGLSIVRTLVEAHGGSIRAENGPDNGAVFHVALPAFDATPTSP